MLGTILKRLDWVTYHLFGHEPYIVLNSYSFSSLKKKTVTREHKTVQSNLHVNGRSLYSRADRILQTLVYKMVPDLFKLEMLQRRDFYRENPYAGKFCMADGSGEDSMGLYI